MAVGPATRCAQICGGVGVGSGGWRRRDDLSLDPAKFKLSVGIERSAASQFHIIQRRYKSTSADLIYYCWPSFATTNMFLFRMAMMGAELASSSDSALSLTRNKMGAWQQVRVSRSIGLTGFEFDGVCFGIPFIKRGDLLFFAIFSRDFPDF